MATGWQRVTGPGSSVKDTWSVVVDPSSMVDESKDRPSAPRDCSKSFQAVVQVAPSLTCRTTCWRRRFRCMVSGPPRATSARAGSSTAETS